MESKHYGLGAMLRMLSGNADAVEAYQSALGKVIKALSIDDSKDGELKIRFTDDTGIRLFDDARSCCESRYMRTDDDLNYHIGATFIAADVKDGPSEKDDEWGGVHEIQFLTVTTSKGQFTCASHNEHNGYYGGIIINIAKE